MDEPEKQESNRGPDGKFKPGFSGNPNGRPKGPTLKEWARSKLEQMTDEERNQFIKDLPNDIIWKMAEGMPKQDTSVTGADGGPLELIIKRANEEGNTAIQQAGSGDIQPPAV